MKNINVSIIVPVYNTEQYIEKCLNSIKNQTLTNIEVIVVDDGSVDNSRLIIKKFITQDNRFKYIYKENGGLSSARNEGLKHVCGKWVCFIDSDDYIEKTMIEELYNSVQKHNADLGVCGETIVYKDKEILRLPKENKVIEINDKNLEYILINEQDNLGVSVWNKIYKYEIIKYNNLKFEPNKEIFAEDLLFNLYYQFYCTKIVCIRKSLYRYLVRKGSIMNSPKEDLIFKFSNLIQKYESYSKNIDKFNIIESFTPILTIKLINATFKEIVDNNDDNSIINNLKICRTISTIKDNLIKLIKGKNYPIKRRIAAYIYFLMPICIAKNIIKLSFNKQFK